MINIKHFSWIFVYVNLLSSLTSGTILNRIKYLLFSSFLFQFQFFTAQNNPKVIHYYQTTKYTITHPWSQTTVSSPPEPIATVLEGGGGQPTFPNNLQTNPTALDLTLIPPNPVPMLNPNPLANSEGMQISLASQNEKNPLGLPERQYEGSFCRRSFDGRSGYCIVAYQCLHVIKEFRVHGTKIDVCTYRKNIPVICCTLADKHIDDQRLSAKKCQEYQEAVRGIKLEDARNFSGKLCMSSMPMIVGGEIANQGEYSHMVNIMK